MPCQTIWSRHMCLLKNPRDQNKLGINETKADIVKMPKWYNIGPVSPSDERSL